MWRLTVAVACVVLFLGSTRAVADGDADEYFKLMRQYLGEDGFARHPCLAEQERNGWTSTRGVPMSPFTVGVEGVGHHAIEVGCVVQMCIQLGACVHRSTVANPQLCGARVR